MEKLNELTTLDLIPNSEIASYKIGKNPQLGRTLNKLPAKSQNLSKTGKRKKSRKKSKNGNPKAFISYSWDSPSHKKWVRDFGSHLRENGIDVTLDQWDLKAGQDKYKFMEQSITKSDFVFLICTPTYGKKANERIGGAGFEYTIISTEMFDKFKDKSKFICILRSGKYQNSVPKYFQALIHLDFSNKEKAKGNYEKLLRQVFNEPKFKKPRLGKPPILIESMNKGNLKSQKIRLEVYIATLMKHLN